jgi:hypothetical protein
MKLKLLNHQISIFKSRKNNNENYQQNSIDIEELEL